MAITMEDPPFVTPEPVDPHILRKDLEAKIIVLQHKLAALVQLKESEARRSSVTTLRQEIASCANQVRELDEILAYTPPTSIATFGKSAVGSGGSDSAPTSSSTTSNIHLQPDFRLPSSLPKFTAGLDVDDFLDDLVNTLVANNTHSSRYTSALLACCSTHCDATWVRQVLLNLPWEQAASAFSERFRDPMRLHRLQGDFYNLRKLPSESMLDFSAKFQKYVDRLRLNGPDLVPHFIGCLSNPLAANLQLYAINRPDLELPELIKAALALERAKPCNQSSERNPQSHMPSYNPGSVSSSSTHQDRSRRDQLCEYHGVGNHSSASCSVLAAQVKKAGESHNQYCSHHGWCDHTSAVCRTLLRYPTYVTNAHGRNHPSGSQFLHLAQTSNRHVSQQPVWSQAQSVSQQQHLQYPPPPASASKSPAGAHHQQQRQLQD